jgi:hypothetical protein
LHGLSTITSEEAKGYRRRFLASFAEVIACKCMENISWHPARKSGCHQGVPRTLGAAVDQATVQPLAGTSIYTFTVAGQNSTSEQVCSQQFIGCSSQRVLSTMPKRSGGSLILMANFAPSLNLLRHSIVELARVHSMP